MVCRRLFDERAGARQFGIAIDQDEGRIHRTISASTLSRVDCEPVLSAMLLAEANDALIVGDQRTSKLDRRRNQKSVRRIAVCCRRRSMRCHGR